MSITLTQRQCACGCGLSFRVLATAPLDASHIYASRECRFRVEGDYRLLEKYAREGIDAELKAKFEARTGELLDKGLKHREIVEILRQEKVLTAQGKAVSMTAIRNCVFRRRKK